MKLQWEKRERFFKEMTFQIVLRGGKDLGRWRVTDGASLVAQLAKNLCAMWETQVRSLGWEDPLKKGKATPQYSGLENSSPWDCKESDMTEKLSLSVLLLVNSLISTDFILREPWKVGNMTFPPVKIFGRIFIEIQGDEVTCWRVHASAGKGQGPELFGLQAHGFSIASQHFASEECGCVFLGSNIPLLFTPRQEQRPMGRLCIQT